MRAIGHQIRNHDFNMFDNRCDRCGMTRDEFSKNGQPECLGERLLVRSALAKQLVNDKPDHWEYKLTAELLRFGLRPVLRQWSDLDRGLYVRPSTTVVGLEQAVAWLRTRMTEIVKLVDAVTGLANGELQSSWGPAGHPGDAEDIVRVCSLLTECAKGIVEWEERVRFAVLPYAFDEVRGLLIGIAGRILTQLELIPAELAAIFACKKPSGTHHISLTIDLPDGWADEFTATLDRLASAGSYAF
jgi:hypothetical protein